MWPASHDADDDAFEEDALDDLWRPPEQPSPTHGGWPITGYNDGEPIPNLGCIPREQWRAVLEPLSSQTRQLARATVVSVGDAEVAGIIVGELMTDEPRSRALNAPPPALPAGAALARPTSRQVNFRLGPGDHARLQEVARLYALRPSALARLLTVRGVNLALQDERRAP